jgi:hypothetical protein
VRFYAVLANGLSDCRTTSLTAPIYRPEAPLNLHLSNTAIFMGQGTIFVADEFFRGGMSIAQPRTRLSADTSLPLQLAPMAAKHGRGTGSSIPEIKTFLLPTRACMHIC